MANFLKVLRLQKIKTLYYFFTSFSWIILVDCNTKMLQIS